MPGPLWRPSVDRIGSGVRETALTRVLWDGGNRYEMVLEARCDAPPFAVYDVLANLETHLDWAGRKQRHGFRVRPMWTDRKRRRRGTRPSGPRGRRVDQSRDVISICP